jgi:hypothetical protein
MVGDLRSPNGTALVGSGGVVVNSSSGTTATFISVNANSAVVGGGA